MPDLRIALLRDLAVRGAAIPHERSRCDASAWRGAAPERHTGACDRVRGCGALRRRGNLFTGTEGHVTVSTRGPVRSVRSGRLELVGACALIVFALFTAATELPLAWLAQLAEALR